MKILCAYSDLYGEFRPNDPKEELKGHEVTVAGSYTDIKTLLVQTTTEPFAIICSDSYLPWSLNSTEVMPVSLLSPYIEETLVRGIGMFIPEHFESEFSITFCSNLAMVADKSCRSIDGK